MKTHLQITGMTCDHCVQAVTKALGAVPGVERALVVLDSGHADVEGDVPLDALIAAVEEEGYTATAAS